MAVDADPQSSRRLVLTKHQEKPEPEQPVFFIRRLRRRESKALAPVLEALGKLTTTSPLPEAERLFDEVEKFVKSGLVGWENQTDPDGKPIPYDPDSLDLCIDEAELFELAVLMRTEHLGTREKKVSGSPLESSTEPAEETASPGPEVAPTNPVRRTPSSSDASNAKGPEDLTEPPAESAADEAS